MSEPQVGAAAGGREEESPSADHGAETQAGGVLLFGGWRRVGNLRRLPGREEGLEVSCTEDILFIGALQLLLTSASF